MHETDPAVPRELGHDRGGVGVDRMRPLWLCISSIDTGLSGGVDDGGGPVSIQGMSNGRRIGDVQLRARQPRDLTAPDQRRPYESTRTRDEYPQVSVRVSAATTTAVATTRPVRMAQPTPPMA